ncbi:hypothetical protein ACFV4M_29285 [Kitasatospora indigofera]|uniref:hypothetical protein n=1 Tax=Kitasatospora indigofera TaxID=67307 RepID=UPI003663A2FE
MTDARPAAADLGSKTSPRVIGSGIPLFRAPFLPAGFTLTDSRVFNTGATITTYATNQK